MIVAGAAASGLLAALDSTHFALETTANHLDATQSVRCRRAGPRPHRRGERGAVPAAARFAIMRFDVVESEAELGFAALHQLLRPHLPQLPYPQRRPGAR